MIEAIGISVIVALLSIIGAAFFAHDKQLIGIERFVIPVAVGVFLSLVLNELIPETVEASPQWGSLVIMIGFVFFYVLSHKLHERFHQLEEDNCDKKGAASLLLIGDSIHNFADGIVLGGAFLINPTVGVATAIGLALHEIPQEIVEFGVLLRAGYTRGRAIVLNLISASTIVLGTVAVMLLSEYISDWVWVLTGLAGGNLLYLAASDLLPRIHGNLKHYGSIWSSAASILLGFVLMGSILGWVHAEYGEGHLHEVGEHEAHEEGER